MQFQLRATKLHQGSPVEVEMDMTVTAAEMIEVYQSAPEIVRQFRAIMTEEKAEAKARKNMKKGNQNVR